MPAWDRAYATTPSGTATLTTTSEGVALTSQGFNAPQPNSTVVISAHILLTTGASVTGVTYRVRRASLTGTQIYTSGIIVTAAASLVSFDLMCVDATPGDVASGLYVVTATQAAATGNGTVQVGSTLTMLAFT